MALQRSARIFDLVLVSITFVATFAMSSGSYTWLSFEEVLVLRIKIVNVFMFGGYLTFCSAIMSYCGFYLTHRLSPRTRRLREILIATTLITVVIWVLRWPFQLEFATDKFLLVFWFLTCAALVSFHGIGQQLLYCFRLQGRNLRNIIIVGEGKDATALANRIEKETTLGYRVVRVINAEEA
jgi:FlaA1/EpsC-like NDP-sugar epimerase